MALGQVIEKDFLIEYIKTGMIFFFFVPIVALLHAQNLY